jgi:signal transduction histidine kinase
MASRQEIQVCVRCDEGLPRVEAGRGWMRCVLVNLCRNGIQAMGRAGVLQIRARLALTSPPFSGWEKGSMGGWGKDFSPPQGWVEVVVRDTGCGIPASAIERVWDPFFTTKPDGMGIGLAVVKSLVEGQGGRVRLESQPGRGTAVTVWFRTGRQEVEDAEGAGD